MPGSADRDAELFARALDHGPDGLDQPVGEELERDLHLVRLLTAAAGSGAGSAGLPGPDRAARERMRRRVLAGLAATPPMTGVTGGTSLPEAGAPSRPSPFPRGRTGEDPTSGSRVGEGTAEGVGPREAVGPAPSRVAAAATAAPPAALEPAGPAAAPEPAAEDADVVPIAVARRRRISAGLHGRLLVAAAASLCLLLALSGMSLVLARDALPGDALYGVKRSAESAELGLTFGTEPRGFKHLQFATARLDELEALTARSAGLGTPDAARFLQALQAFDTDAAAGARLLVETATNGDGGELRVLRAWAEQQRARLLEADATMPAAATFRAEGSVRLLTRMTARIDLLGQRLGCSVITTGGRDELGLLPAAGPCLPAATPSQSTVAPTTAGAGPSRGPAVRPDWETPAPTAGGGAPVTTAPFLPGLPGPTTPPVTEEPGEQPGGGVTTPPAIEVPLPLLPPIEVPPLLPGLPGIVVG